VASEHLRPQPGRLRSMDGAASKRVYQWPVHNSDSVDQLHGIVLAHVWRGMAHTIINNATDDWRDRLSACERSHGGHFQQLTSIQLHYDNNFL